MAHISVYGSWGCHGNQFVDAVLEPQEGAREGEGSPKVPPQPQGTIYVYGGTFLRLVLTDGTQEPG